MKKEILKASHARQLHKVIRGKLKNRRGATLAETLFAVALLSIIMVIVTSAVATSLNVYRKVRKKADAEELLATTISALNGDLTRADVSKAGDANPTFYSEYRSENLTFTNGTDGVLMNGMTVVTKGTRGFESLYTAFTTPEVTGDVSWVPDAAGQYVAYLGRSGGASGPQGGYFVYQIEVRDKTDGGKILAGPQVVYVRTMNKTSE